jgi:hypothetical protein
VEGQHGVEGSDHDLIYKSDGGTKKNHENLSQGNLSLGRDVNLLPSQCESGGQLAVTSTATFTDKSVKNLNCVQVVIDVVNKRRLFINCYFYPIYICYLPKSHSRCPPEVTIFTCLMQNII